MKIIEALTECANGKDFENCKMKYKEMEFERFNEYEIYDDLYNEEITLNDEIEIIEEVEDKEYEDIEEGKEIELYKIYQDYLENKSTITMANIISDIEVIFNENNDKINALIKNQKKLIERINNASK